MDPIRRLEGSSSNPAYANQRFEHNCKRAIVLQAQMRERGLSSREAPKTKESIEECLNIAASIKGWEAVREYIFERCSGNDIYICLLCTIRFLEKYDGMTKQEIELQLQIESDELDRRLLESIFTRDEELDLD